MRANLKGKIVNMVDPARVEVETVCGIALLDADDVLDYRFREGDEISVEDAGWYISNGLIITILGYKYTLNGTKIVHPDI